MNEENVQKGFVKLYRSLLDWEWYSDLNTRAVFMHMLLRANYADQKFEGQHIPRGSFVSSRHRLSQEVGVSERSLRTALKHLKATGEVTSTSFAKYTIYKVVNYESYQASDQQSDQQVTSKRPASDQQATTIKERKKERKEEGKNTRAFNPFNYLETNIQSASLREALEAFVQMRKLIRKPVSTERAMKALLNELDKLGRTEQEKVMIVDQSTASSWLKFYPLKGDNRNGNNSKPYQDFSDVIGWGPEGNIEQLIQQQREQEQRQNARASAGEGEAMDTGELPNSESDGWETQFDGWDQLF